MRLSRLHSSHFIITRPRLWRKERIRGPRCRLSPRAIKQITASFAAFVERHNSDSATNEPAILQTDESSFQLERIRGFSVITSFEAAPAPVVIVSHPRPQTSRRPLRAKLGLLAKQKPMSVIKQSDERSSYAISDTYRRIIIVKLRRQTRMTRIG